ncbi:hypothetical protein NUW58_g10770 [Xylaria curta]|uniref:Uncharacterized protein n=1 Tax=Xylaria curta TaxID=42375 RepID=A0ACC1MID6_9PEZI|nr:hypothetical protein NUW58_g10770 [Xylaria curta]
MSFRSAQSFVEATAGVDGELGGGGVAAVVEAGGTSSCRADVIEKERAKDVDDCSNRPCWCIGVFGVLTGTRGLTTLWQLDMAPIGRWRFRAERGERERWLDPSISKVGLLALSRLPHSLPPISLTPIGKLCQAFPCPVSDLQSIIFPRFNATIDIITTKRLASSLRIPAGRPRTSTRLTGCPTIAHYLAPAMAARGVRGLNEAMKSLSLASHQCRDAASASLRIPSTTFARSMATEASLPSLAANTSSPSSSTLWKPGSSIYTPIAPPAGPISHPHLCLIRSLYAQQPLFL